VQHPTRSYAALGALWTLGASCLSEETSALDVALLAAATFKGSRVVVHERIGECIRQPLKGNARRPEEHDGMRRALCELTSCTRCTGTWVALGLGLLCAVEPRIGKPLVRTLAVGAANDFAQAAFARLTR
jgi:hypothetical protein